MFGFIARMLSQLLLRGPIPWIAPQDVEFAHRPGCPEQGVPPRFSRCSCKVQVWLVYLPKKEARRARS